jgi:prepilin-type N-terminal cleavage/methylation domain-containing protein
MLGIDREWSRRDDKGFTLVEMLTAITLTTIVIGLATGFLIQALDQGTKLTQQTEAQNRNNVAMERATRLLRQAVYPKNGSSTSSSIITVAQADKVQFTSRFVGTGTASTDASDPIQQFVIQTDATGTKLQWGAAAQLVTSGCTAGTAVCTYGSPVATRTLLDGIRNSGKTATCSRNTGDGAVFHYWMVNDAGSLVAWSSTANTLSQIRVVQIDLWTKTRTGTLAMNCVHLSDYVQLRNSL